MTLLESALRRDRLLVLIAVSAVVLLAWLYTLAGIGMEMNALQATRPGFAWADGPGAPGKMTTTTGDSGWSLAQAGLMLAMWWAMMIAMMLPGATPTVLLAAALNRRSDPANTPFGSTGFFVTGYLGTWLFFSLAAVVAQAVLQRLDALTSMLESNSAALTGALMTLAGAWQLSPLKEVCLRHCRSPADFLTRRRHPGNRGALRMGIEHGTYCLGCCWLLMGLLFAGGVMNLYWIVGLAAYVLVEKTAPAGLRISRGAGAALICTGTVLLAFSTMQ